MSAYGLAASAAVAAPMPATATLRAFARASPTSTPSLSRSFRGAAPVAAASRRPDSINAMAADVEEVDEEEEEAAPAAPPPPPTPPLLAPTTAVGPALAAGRAAMGRPLTEADAVLVDRLEGRGIGDVGGLVTLTPASAAALRVPADLLALLSAGVSAWEADSGGAGATGGKAKARGVRSRRGGAAVPSPTLAAAARPLPGRAAAPAPTLASSSASTSSASFAGDPSAPPPAAAAVAAIEARHCPPMDRYKIGFLQDPDAPRVRTGGGSSAATGGAFSPATGVLRIPPGASPRLDADLARLRKFLTGRFPGQQQAPIRPVTAAKYDDHLRRWAGWWAGMADDEDTGLPPTAEAAARRASVVDLATLIPGTGPDAAALAMEYAAWLEDERRVTPHTSGLFLRSALAAAKCVHHKASAARPRDGDRAYADLGVVRELRGLSKDARAAGKRAPPAGDEAVKWLEWGEYLSLVAELKSEAAGRDHQGRRRSPAAVAWSVQRYLIFAILACVPDRQRTLRELEVGRTLVWEGPKSGGGGGGGGSGSGGQGEAAGAGGGAFASGRWTIRHGADDYKTGGTYGPRPPLVLSPSLYPELGAFISTFRAALKPADHGRLFCMKNGEPLTSQALHRLFVSAAYRLTGQKTNPHLVRDMVVTHVRAKGDATEAELEALALYMGHSVAMQRATYDRRTVSQKVEPAVDLLARLNGEGGGGGVNTGL